MDQNKFKKNAKPTIKANRKDPKFMTSDGHLW